MLTVVISNRTASVTRLVWGGVTVTRLVRGGVTVTTRRVVLIRPQWLPFVVHLPLCQGFVVAKPLLRVFGLILLLVL